MLVDRRGEAKRQPESATTLLLLLLGLRLSPSIGLGHRRLSSGFGGPGNPPRPGLAKGRFIFPSIPARRPLHSLVDSNSDRFVKTSRVVRPPWRAHGGAVETHVAVGFFWPTHAFAVSPPDLSPLWPQPRQASRRDRKDKSGRFLFGTNTTALKRRSLAGVHSFRPARRILQGASADGLTHPQPDGQMSKGKELCRLLNMCASNKRARCYGCQQPSLARCKEGPLSRAVRSPHTSAHVEQMQNAASDSFT